MPQLINALPLDFEDIIFGLYMVDIYLLNLILVNYYGGNIMGNRDFGGKEKKKEKKDIKKKPIISSMEEAKPEVEVIRKGKKNKAFED